MHVDKMFLQILFIIDLKFVLKKKIHINFVPKHGLSEWDKFYH